MPNAVVMSVSRTSIYILLLLDIYTITSHTIWNVYLYIKKIHIYSIYISSFFLSSFSATNNNIFLKIGWTHHCLITRNIILWAYIGASHHQQVSHTGTHRLETQNHLRQT